MSHILEEVVFVCVGGGHVMVVPTNKIELFVLCEQRIIPVIVMFRICSCRQLF